MSSTTPTRFTSSLLQALCSLMMCMGTLWGSSTELRVLVPHSFELNPKLIQSFEQKQGIKLSIIKAGSSNEMVHKLLLTQKSPIADAVYGIDRQRHYPKIRHLLSDYQDIAYGTVSFNIDRAWFQKNHLPLPQSLEELHLPRYKNLVSIPNPITSSTGQSFLMATIKYFGEKQSMVWWNQMRLNGLKLAKSWSDMYYRDFSVQGGKRPIVLSYTSSPAAELFYSKTPHVQGSPTQSLQLAGASWLEIEGAAVLASSTQQALAKTWLAWLQSDEVQKDMQTRMWVLPVTMQVPLHPVYSQVGLKHQKPVIDHTFIWQDAWLHHWKRQVYRRFAF